MNEDDRFLQVAKTVGVIVRVSLQGGRMKDPLPGSPSPEAQELEMDVVRIYTSTGLAGAAVGDDPALGLSALSLPRLPGGCEAGGWVRQFYRSPFAVNPPSETAPARAQAFLR
jgi:hypothetical protein